MPSDQGPGAGPPRWTPALRWTERPARRPASPCTARPPPARPPDPSWARRRRDRSLSPVRGADRQVQTEAQFLQQPEFEPDIDRGPPWMAQGRPGKPGSHRTWPDAVRVPGEGGVVGSRRPPQVRPARPHPRVPAPHGVRATRRYSCRVARVRRARHPSAHRLPGCQIGLARRDTPPGTKPACRPWSRVQQGCNQPILAVRPCRQHDALVAPIHVDGMPALWLVVEPDGAIVGPGASSPAFAHLDVQEEMHGSLEHLGPVRAAPGRPICLMRAPPLPRKIAR